MNSTEDGRGARYEVAVIMEAKLTSLPVIGHKYLYIIQ